MRKDGSVLSSSMFWYMAGYGTVSTLYWTTKVWQGTDMWVVMLFPSKHRVCLGDWRASSLPTIPKAVFLPFLPVSYGVYVGWSVKIWIGYNQKQIHFDVNFDPNCINFGPIQIIRDFMALFWTHTHTHTLPLDSLVILEWHIHVCYYIKIGLKLGCSTTSTCHMVFIYTNSGLKLISVIIIQHPRSYLYS